MTLRVTTNFSKTHMPSVTCRADSRLAPNSGRGERGPQSRTWAAFVAEHRKHRVSIPLRLDVGKPYLGKPTDR
ncbi:hypothetical protein Nans01_37020 [Nocardiopsis ansamitocini]|uniref:Uncharacterized protein n=1 Tax=Nocardiopsis ansamitocini TaxID=1670832 RepID=A0A9W6UHY0_9ACTN|nr:hypothetical protein Nans01_37020 [Nocardiopsis ansamitocini]